MADFNSQIVDEFRANAGVVGGPFDGATLLLLHTTGAKSGQERVVPLVYRSDGNNLVVFGSKGGAPSHPDWYRNLVANPKATVEVGTDRFDVVAHTAEGDERTRIWELQKQEVPQFAQYEQNTDREIPVVVLERVA